MTIHIILPTADQTSMVWVTDRLGVVGLGNAVAMEKITYLEEQKIACSAWGDHAFRIRDEFVNRIRHGSIDLSDPKLIPATLNSHAAEIMAILMLPPHQQPRGRGVIVGCFKEARPRTYISVLQGTPFSSEVQNEIWIGDEENPARIFASYYYPRSRRTVEDALTFAIHAISLAHKTKMDFIGEPNAWVFRNGLFSPLPPEELSVYIARSGALDAAILNSSTT